MTPEEIDGLMEDNGLAITRTRTESNPFMPGDKTDLSHFYCTISGGGIEAFEFYFSHTDDVAPEDSDVVGVLVSDIKVYRGCTGYEEFLRVFKLNDDEDRADVRLAWEELGRLAPLVEQVIDMAHVATPTAAPSVGMTG